MTHSFFFAAIAALAIAATPAIAEEMARVEWSQLLDPSAQEFEDPYRDLAPEQMSDLMSLVRLREGPGGEGPTTEGSRQVAARTAELEAALQEAGVDVEWLLSQRWVVAERRHQAAISVNRSLDGQSAEIAGFLILAPPNESGEASAYLLPDRGVCNHLPPPPPNQLVRLLLQDVPEIAGSCVPAVVGGILRAEESRHEVIVIDHSLPMWSAWTLEAEEVRAVASSTSDGASPRKPWEPSRQLSGRSTSNYESLGQGLSTQEVATEGTARRSSCSILTRRESWASFVYKNALNGR